MRRSLAVAGVLGMLVAGASHAGEFDRVEGDRLQRLLREDKLKPETGLGERDLLAIPPAFPDERSAFLVVKTDRGNFARLLVSPAFRKPANGEGDLVPIMRVDRFDTFEPGKLGSRTARGSNLFLFEGFQLDLDAGQVVPDNQGADLVVKPAGKGAVRLIPAGGASLYSAKTPVRPETPEAGPSPGPGVIPGDFGGRYLLNADGRWTGLLELKVADRQITGRFRSEANGTAYDVTGEVAAELPNRATFTVRFPRTEQEYEAFLWTEGKWALAGTFRMLDRPAGFFAVREGHTPEKGR